MAKAARTYKFPTRVDRHGESQLHHKPLRSSDSGSHLSLSQCTALKTSVNYLPLVRTLVFQLHGRNPSLDMREVQIYVLYKILQEQEKKQSDSKPKDKANQKMQKTQVELDKQGGQEAQDEQDMQEEIIEQQERVEGIFESAEKWYNKLFATQADIEPKTVKVASASDIECNLLLNPGVGIPRLVAQYFATHNNEEISWERAQLAVSAEFILEEELLKKQSEQCIPVAQSGEEQEEQGEQDIQAVAQEKSEKQEEQSGTVDQEEQGELAELQKQAELLGIIAPIIEEWYQTLDSTIKEIEPPKDKKEDIDMSQRPDER